MATSPCHNSATTETRDGSEELMINIESFLIEIDQIPWFANVGKPSELDGQALRITSWEAWPGPETPGSGLMAEAHKDRRANSTTRARATWFRRLYVTHLRRSRTCSSK